MMFAALFLGADWIAGWMKDPHLAGLLRIVFLFLFINAHIFSIKRLFSSE